MLKKLLLLVIILLITTTFNAQTTEKDNSSTYFLIRHAEKDRSDSTNKNPDLTKEGKLRAKRWAKLFEQFHITDVYSTDYNRTFNTAYPTASSIHKSIKLYHPTKVDIQQFLRDTKGKTIVIVGHSNTIPNFVNKLIGKDVYHDIEDNNNANLYIVTLNGEDISHVVIQIK